MIDVLACESAAGTVTIRAGRPRRTLCVFRAGCASVEQAKAWLAHHAVRGWIWRYPDGARVRVTIPRSNV